jgi:hypothetical protein
LFAAVATVQHHEPRLVQSADLVDGVRDVRLAHVPRELLAQRIFLPRDDVVDGEELGPRSDLLSGPEAVHRAGHDFSFADP